MSNDFHIPDDEQSYLQAQIEQEAQEYELFIHELQTLGVKNYEGNRFNRNEIRKANSNISNSKNGKKSLRLQLRVWESGDKPF